MGFVSSLVEILTRLRARSRIFRRERFRNWFRRGTEATLPVIEQTDGKNYSQETNSKFETMAQTQSNLSSFSEEDLHQYRKGGYHPVSLGEVFDDRYEVVRKLGFGQNATVWLAFDKKWEFVTSAWNPSLTPYRLNRYIALKILKAKHYRSTKSIYKVKVLQYIRSNDQTHPGHTRSLVLLDSFAHVGPHGTHICMVFEPMHQDLSILLRRSHDRKVPLVIVKEIARQLLSALDHLHASCDIVHTSRTLLLHLSLDSY